MEHATKPAPDQERGRAGNQRRPALNGAATAVDNRPAATAQRELADAVSESPRVVAQQALSQGVLNSPRAFAEGRRFAGLFGGDAFTSRAPVQRRIDPATVDGQLGATPLTPTYGDALLFLQNVVGPTIAPIKELLTSLPDGAGKGHIATINAQGLAVRTGAAKKGYDGATARRAINDIIAALNAGEDFAEAQMVGPAADFTTSVNAQNNLNNVVVPRYSHVLEMATSLNHPAGINAGPVAAEAADAALKLGLATTAATAGPYNAAVAKAAILTFSNAVNLLQNAAETNMAGSISGSMKIGTEFTFAHPTLAHLNPRNPNSNTAAFRAALAFISQWRDLVESRPVRVTKVPITMVITEDTLTGGSGDGHAPRFTYTWKGGTWWWRLNIDPGCLETQTSPMTTTQATSDTQDMTKTVINTIMNKHVFSIAPLLTTVGEQVAPHETTGGGHITLDSASTFLGNSRFFRNLLVLYANDASWAEEDPDAFNAPTIRELTRAGRAAFRQTIAAYDRTVGTPQPQTIEQLSDALVRDVFIVKHFDPSNDSGDKVARANQAPHYQSTNVEHMTTAERGEKRLEMRRFDAQTSVDDLLGNLERLTSLVAASRRPGLVTLAIPD